MVLSKYSHSILNGLPEYKQSLVVQIFRMNHGTKEENIVTILILDISFMVCRKDLYKGNFAQRPAKGAV